MKTNKTIIDDAINTYLLYKRFNRVRKRVSKKEVYKELMQNIEEIKNKKSSWDILQVDSINFQVIYSKSLKKLEIFIKYKY